MVIFRRFEFSTFWFLSGLIFISGLGAYVNLIYPQQEIAIIGLLAVIAGIIFCFCMFLTRSVRRSVLFTAGGIMFLTLRLFGLREWYFLLLLSLTVFSTDAYLVRSNRTRRV